MTVKVAESKARVGVEAEKRRGVQPQVAQSSREGQGLAFTKSPGPWGEQMVPGVLHGTGGGALGSSRWRAAPQEEWDSCPEADPSFGAARF